MPTSNPVYQPTTVTYERHKEWSSNYITERVIPNCYQKPYLQRLLLVGAIMLAMVGLGLAIYALVNDVNTHKDEPEGPPVFEDNSEEDFEKEETSDSNEPGSHDHATNVVLGSLGITLILVSLVMYVMFLKLRGMCRGLLPHHHSPRSAGNMHSSGGQPIHNDSDHPTVVSYKGVQVTIQIYFIFALITTLILFVDVAGTWGFEFRACCSLGRGTPLFNGQQIPEVM